MPPTEFIRSWQSSRNPVGGLRNFAAFAATGLS